MRHPLVLLALALWVLVASHAVRPLGAGAGGAGVLETGSAPGAILDFRVEISDRNNVLLSWTAPADGAGETVAGYQVVISDRPITDENIQDTEFVVLSPDGDPRGPGIPEIRSVVPPDVPDEDTGDVLLSDIELLCGANDPPPTDDDQLDRALYYAVRALDQQCRPGPVALDDVFTLRKVRVTTDKQDRVELRVEGRVPVKREILEVPADVLLRLSQDGRPIIEFMVPSEGFDEVDGKLRFSDKTGTVVPGLRRMVFKGNKRTTIVARTVKLTTLPPITAGPFSVDYLIGDRPLEETVDLREKGSKLVYP